MIPVRSKLKVPVLHLPVTVPGLTADHLEQIMDSTYSHFVHSSVVRSITHANRIGSNKATMVDVDGRSEYWDIERKNWPSMLQKALNHYEKVEEWETCIQIRDLIIALTYGTTK